MHYASILATVTDGARSQHHRVSGISSPFMSMTHSGMGKTVRDFSVEM